jgi:chaperonin cofactor prefoldin
MATKVKTVEEKELKLLQELNSTFVQLKDKIADLELQKQMIFENVSEIKKQFKNLESELVEKYGDNSIINLETGIITEKT